LPINLPTGWPGRHLLLFACYPSVFMLVTAEALNFFSLSPRWLFSLINQPSILRL
jgi:hypothetical protein